MNSLTGLVTLVLNSLWQAAALAGLVWLALRLAPRVNAATRFAIWWAVLGVVVILPLAPRMIFSTRSALAPRPSQPAKGAHVSAPTPAQGTSLPPVVIVERGVFRQWRSWIAAIWGLIALYRLSQIARSYFYLRGVKRRASRSQESVPYLRDSARLLLSSEIDSPIAVGFLPPAVILPEWLPAKLSKEEFDHALLHEAAHLGRLDDWTNLLARLCDALLALHPVGLWILRQIEIEREAACDDWVVARTKEARSYARSLLRLYELKTAGSPLLAAGIFGRGSRLGSRIETLLKQGRKFTARVSTRSVAASAALLLVLGGFASLSPRWIAFAQDSNDPNFEVASVRPSNPDEGFIDSVTPSLNVSGEHNLTFVHITLRDLIMLAYNVGAPQVQGPRFLNASPDSPADRFDIVARVPAGATKEQIPLMLRALLAERFHLTMHRENKAGQIYALETGKGAVKMKQSPEGATGAARCVRSFAEREGATLAAECTHMTGADIAQQAMALAPGYFRDTPVVDMTGLKDTYDFKIEWITNAEARAGSDGPTMIDAIQNQLGLKLERRRQEIEMLVIDRLDRTPTEN